jgi:hypothetical protein
MVFIGIIYTWICIITGMVYTGQAKSSKNEKIRALINTHEKLLHNRFKGHIRDSKHPNTYFHHAIRKYGPDNFNGKIIEEFSAESLDEIKKLVDKAEQKCIKENNTLAPHGYNLQTGGCSPSFHPTTCKKMQMKKQAFINTDNGRKWIKKCSESQKLYFQTKKGLEQAKKHGDRIRLIYETKPDIKSNIRKTLLDYFDTPAGKIQIEKQKMCMTEFYMTEDGEKMRIILAKHAKKRWEDPEYHANQVSKGTQRFSGEEGTERRANLRAKQTERMKDPDRRKLASEKTKAQFDKKGRKNYKCDNCDRTCRDKTGYDKHCLTKKHKLILSGLSEEEAKNTVQKETSEKISESNKLWAEQNDNPRMGMTHTPESKEKNRLAHLGKTLSESARKKLGATIRKQYEKGERKSGLAKLTDEQVIYIRQNKGIIKQKELADKYHVSVQTISSIQNNVGYKHVKMP